MFQNMLKHCAVVNSDLTNAQNRQNLRAVEVALEQMTGSFFIFLLFS